MNLYRTAAVVTVFALFEHALGFLYRMVLSRVLGPEGLGVYQVALSVFAVCLTVSSSGLPITLSRSIAKHRARGDKAGERAAVTAAIALALLVSVPLTVLLFVFRAPFSRIFSDPRCADLFYILLFSLSFTSVYAILRGSFWGDKRFFAYSLIELIEEIVMIVCGVTLLVFLRSEIPDVNLAAVAVVVSYLCSFSIAVCYFLYRGGKLRSPRGELLPLLRSSAPVTAMRASSSLVNSLVSVLFPMRLMAAGMTMSRAMSEYGVVGGMVMPVLTIPCSLIGSLALVLVPELSECYYTKQRDKLAAHIGKGLSTTLLIASTLAPVFLACGEGIGVLFFASAESGKLISYSALILFPMSLTMILTSMLNSLGCERHTLFFFLAGSAGMLVCVWTLPPYLGNGALLVGMACDHLITSVCSIALLVKRTGKLRVGGFCARLALFFVLTAAVGVGAQAVFSLWLGFLPALLCSLLSIAAAELLFLQLLRLCDVKALFKKLPHPRFKRLRRA